MQATRFGRLLAGVLSVATLALPFHSNLLAATDSVMLGRVTGADGLEPRAGVVVALVDGAGEAAYRSSPTDTRGAFRIGGAASGTYRVLVETDSGAFLASDGVVLKAGDNGPVSLALRPNSQGAPQAPATPPSGGRTARAGIAPWAKWMIVGGIVVGGAIIINSLNDDKEGSPYF